MEQTGKLAMETLLKVDVSKYFKAGDVVYLYKYNKKAKKLDCLPNSKYTVDSDAYVTLNIISGADYVLLKKPAKATEKRGLLSQVSYSKKVQMSKQQTIQQFFKFPDSFYIVSKLNKFNVRDYLSSIDVTVTYKSSNKKIVQIS